jgi:hypothetical protein
VSVEDMGTAVSEAARNVHVPGTPLTLRLDRVKAADGACHLWWSYRDPTGESSDGRVRGETSIDVRNISDGDVGGLCWDAAQLAAAHRWVFELDGDEMPGVPYVPRTWTIDEAWRALLVMLSRYGTVSQTGASEITVRDSDGTDLIFRLDPAEWAAYVALPEEVANDDIVPTAVPLVDDLPLWVSDEMSEMLGSSGAVIGLVDGDLRALTDQ